MLARRGGEGDGESVNKAPNSGSSQLALKGPDIPAQGDALRTGDKPPTEP
jgi:hypothetical protein